MENASGCANVGKFGVAEGWRDGVKTIRVNDKPQAISYKLNYENEGLFIYSKNWKRVSNKRPSVNIVAKIAHTVGQKVLLTFTPA